MTKNLSVVFGLLLFFAGLSSYSQDAHALRHLQLRGYLAYSNGAQGKSFTWSLTYDPNKTFGYNCWGSIKDLDGAASFRGYYVPGTGSLRLVKHYIGRRTGRSRFYYRGYIRGNKLSGTAHFDSYYGQKYGGWAATVLWTNNYVERSERLYLRGYLKYFGRRAGGKSFSWNLTYYPETGVCQGSVNDRDGYATFTGTYDSRSNKFRLVKNFVKRRASGGKKYFYYTGYVDRRGRYSGTAKFNSFWGRSYGRWTASKY